MPVIAQTCGAAPFPVRRFTVDEYHRMIQAGVLNEDEPVELIEGWIVPKMPHNPPHDATVDQSQDVLRRRLPNGWRLRVQSAITTNDSEPEPDLVIVPGPAGRYRSQHPHPDEIALIIEVADSSLAQYRGAKATLYARERISEYWIINIPAAQVEVFTDPSGPDPAPRYRQQQVFRGDESTSLTILGQKIGEVTVCDLLG